jgi:hypothetical protein
MTPSFDTTSLRARLPIGLDPLEISDTARRHGPAIAGWALPFVLVLYLALKGGGYDDVVRGEVGVAVWWIVLLGALAGVLPVARLGRVSWIGLGILVAFGVWTAFAVIWSDSTGRTVSEVGRVATYAGVFALALSAQGRDGLRRTVNAVATAIGVVAALALLSRFHPAWFPTDTTPQFLPSIGGRLNYPLNYWNGLSALMAVGMPLMLVAASRTRRIPLQALAAAALPVMALTIYYTFSRGGVLETAVALVVLVALYPRRLSLILMALPAFAGAAILIAAAQQRDALDQALNDSTAHSQGTEMIAIVLIVCAGVALVQVAIALAARHDVGPRLWPSRRASLIALGVAVVAAIAIGTAVGGPGKLSNAWDTFKNPSGPSATGAGRFTSASGNGRYQYWQSSVDANATDELTGIGPGTWEFWWAEHGTITGFVLNAHSLYFETLAEAGIVGVVLIGGFLIWILAVGARRALTRSRDRALFAAATAAAAAFAVAAAVDWVWQLAVIPVAFLLVAAAILNAPDDEEPEPGDAGALGPRLALGGLAIVALVGIAIPLAGSEAVSQSQAEVRAANLGAALSDARTALDIQPYSANASIQEALVLELNGDFAGAAAAAQAATTEEPDNWENWVVLSRTETELGNTTEAIAAYRKAKQLNPRSALFAQ